MAHQLDQKGLIDSKGHLRVHWLQMLATYIDKAIRLDQLLGLNRRPRRVESPIEWLERRSREANSADTTDSVTQQRDTATTRHGDEEDL
jgi:hypothetical protein